jgi:hypothetical protein
MFLKNRLRNYLTETLWNKKQFHRVILNFIQNELSTVYIYYILSQNV